MPGNLKTRSLRLAALLLLVCLIVLLPASGQAQEGSPALQEQPTNQPRDYYWTWYDNVGARNWVLMANPEGSSATQSFELTVGSQKQDIAPFPLQSADCQQNPCGAGVVPEGMTLSPRFPGLIGGPVKASSLDGSKAIVSQRTLWAQNSLDEVPGTEAGRLSDHFYWTWYDQKSAGYKNWVLVANPNGHDIYYEITIAGQDPGPGSKGVIAPGNNVTPTFPGHRGGPVEVRTWTDAGKGTPAKAMASQRVLSNNDTAFNEEPGIPAEELSDHYLWTWYDQKSAGAKNWLLVANPNEHDIYYEITIAGEDPGQGSKGTIAPSENATPTFPGHRGGPVEVRTWTDAGKGTPADSIASQRVTWGPSFEETPGYPQSALASEYHWTWYDQKSPGSTNWVLVANPGNAPVYYEIRIGGVLAGPGAKGTIQPGENITPTFPSQMAGPVRVSAWTDATKASPAMVMASQRVTWNGYFNEVAGTVIDPPLVPVVPETTEVLGSATSSHLASISEDGSILVFAGTDEELAQVKSLSPGDIIVIDPCTAAPYGLLRKVESIDTSTPGQVRLVTSQATMEDALIQGSIRLDTDDLTTQAMAPAQLGGAVQASTVGLGTYTISLDKTLYEENNVQVKAAGSISISPSFDFEADVGWRGIKRVKFVDNTTETSNLSITATGSVGFDKKWEVWSQTLPSIKFAIGPVPVWITPVVKVYVGANGEVYAQVTTGVTQEARFTAGLEYDNGNWRTISGFKNSFSFQPPTLAAGANFKAYARPQLDLMIYSVTGPYVFVDGYLRLDANINADPWWTLYGGIDAGVGVKVEVLGHGVNYDKSFSLFEWEIAHADNATDPPPANTGPTVTNVRPSGIIYTTDVTISADYSDSDGIDSSSVSIILDGIILPGCSATEDTVECLVSGISEGNHSIGGSVMDNAGHLSKIAGSFTVINSEPGITKIADGGMAPMINDVGQIVWSSSDGNDVEIYLYTPGIGIEKITNNNYPDVDPQINEAGQITWQGDVDSFSEIYFFSTETGVIRVTNNYYSDFRPQINDAGQVVWSGYDGNDTEVYRYIPGQEINKMSDSIYHDSQAKINNYGQIVWSRRINGVSEVYLYTPGQGTIKLASNGSYVSEPQINAVGQVAWTGIDSEIYLYTPGYGIANISDSDLDDFSPMLNDAGQVVWRSRIASTTEIFLYSPEDGIVMLTDNNVEDWNHQINSVGQVVWQSEEVRNYIYHPVYLFSAREGTVKLAEHSFYYSPQINNSGQVVWVLGGIYLYTPS